jgi:small basic protein
MTRRIQTTQMQATGEAPTLDTYFDRVVKYIPADIVAAWVAVTGLVKSADNTVPKTTVLWVCFFVGIVLTAAWTWKQTNVGGLPAALKQIVVATIAFGVWVFALGAPFDALEWYRPLYASILLIGYTLAVGLIVE